MVAIPENGRLDELSLPRLLIALNDARFSGRLQLLNHPIRKVFLFASGGAVSAESNLASDSLGAQLLDAGRISQDEYSRFISLIDNEGLKEGAALFKLGLMDSRELFIALKKQIRNSILECFSWPAGQFAIDADAIPPKGALSFQPDLFALLQDGIEAHWRSDQVFGELESNLMRFATSNAQFNSIQQRLSSDDALIAFGQALDGTRTLWNALQQATTPRAMAAAWVLDATGGVNYFDEAAVDEKAPIEIEVVFRDTAAAKLGQAAPLDRATPQPSAQVDSRAWTELQNEITQRFERLDELDYYELFELESDAPATAIKKAYLQAAKRYHPDTLTRAGLEHELRQKANKIFASISKAHSVLSNPRQRAEYDASRHFEGGPIDAERLANAETLYRKGEILLGLGNFKGAVEFLAPAVELWPDEADYCSALGWALYKKLPSEPERSREHLEHAVELAPKDANASHRLSLVLRSLGRTADADAWLNHARRLDPNIA